MVVVLCVCVCMCVCVWGGGGGGCFTVYGLNSKWHKSFVVPVLCI